MGDWRYEIKHGPDGEEIYAWVYDDHGTMVCTAKTHHAIAICAAAATVKRLTKERDHYLSNWKDARRYLTIETGHAEDAEARADTLATELAKAREALDTAKSLIDEGRWVIAQGVIRAALPTTPEPQP
jgi:hypothetical protein